MAGYAIACEADAVMAVIVLSGMEVGQDGVISRMVLGRCGSGRRDGLPVIIVKRDDPGQLSDHEQADQYRNDPPKAPKPLHR
ncbi:MAG TPA: hypothetical protein VH684_05985 [Xanthobacteraceae bacterium]|jgi:hypothetical protein